MTEEEAGMTEEEDEDPGSVAGMTAEEEAGMTAEALLSLPHEIKNIDKVTKRMAAAFHSFTPILLIKFSPV